MKLIFFAFVLLIIGSSIYGQDIVPEKVKKVDSLLTVASAEVSNVNPIGVIESATKALTLSREINYSRGKAMSSFYIGQVLIYMGDYEKSLEYLQLSQKEKYTSKNDIIKSEICRIKGQVFFYLGLKEASFREFQKAYEYAIRIKEKKERDRYVSLAYENLGIAYTAVRNKPDSTFYFYRKNKELLDKTDENLTFRNKINLYTLIGNYYRDKEVFDSATVWYNQSNSLITKYDYPYSSWLCAHWSDLHLMKGEPDAALNCVKKGLECAKRTNLRNELPGLYQKITTIYSKNGMEDSARFYQNMYQEISDELSTSREGATEKAMQLLLEEERKYAQMRFNKTLSIIVYSIIATLLGIYLFWQQWRKRKKAILEATEREVSVLQDKLNDAFDEVIELARENDPSFLARFRMIYPEFINNLLKAHPQLIESELWLCAMVYLNFSSKEIAQYAFITHRSVQTRKSRLRKKLGIPADVDLYQYMTSLS